MFSSSTNYLQKYELYFGSLSETNLTSKTCIEKSTSWNICALLSAVSFLSVDSNIARLESLLTMTMNVLNPELEVGSSAKKSVVTTS